MKLSSALSSVALLAAYVTAFPAPRNSLDKRDPPGTTLQEGYYWVRAVVEPYFHYYLQTDPVYSASTAIMGEPATAGQFQITDGQFEALIDTDGTVFYLNPGQANDTSTTKLPVTFKETKSTLGTFEWQGDAVTWSDPSIERSNTAAFLICDGGELFINLGAYGYDTPEGCSDATIHYYNGETADE